MEMGTNHAGCLAAAALAAFSCSMICCWSTLLNTLGALKRIPTVPPTVTPKKRYNKSRSITIATYFQSSRICKFYS